MIDSIKEKNKAKKENLIACPSCGSYIEKADACYKCGAKINPKDRISLKKLNLSVLIIGLIGISLLFYAFYEANKITPINKIDEGMNGKSVQISGIIIDIDYDSSYQKTSFTVNDSTGSIDFYGWSDFSSALQEEPIFPGIGDNVIVQGTVDVYDGYYGAVIQIEVTSTKSYELQYNAPIESDVNQIGVNNLTTKVSIEGQVIDKYIKYSGSSINFVILTVSDITGDIEVFISDSLLNLAGEQAIIPDITDNVQIIGMVDEYDGDPQIIPTNATNNAITIIEV
ncbi:MAG: hypothetical protein GF364_07385 [Candidatus Lokiarchaeota archaeon]|nr:hypothetical protein [Candidatus Lokiarchaeota archaeon]